MTAISRDEVLRRFAAGESLERADLRELQLEGATLVGINLSRADLSGANLAGADLTDAVLTNANLREAFLQGAELEGASLRNADLDGANLAGANLQGCDLRRANLEGANLEVAQLGRARLQNAMLADAKLGKADLEGASLRSADVTDAYLGGTALRGTDLRRAILDGANLEDADAFEADLRECDLDSAILNGAVFTGARVYGISVAPDLLETAVVEWWDVSRDGDGSARETGDELGAFLRGPPPAGGAAAPAARPGTRYFGEGDVLKNADLEFNSGSHVEVQGRFENCRIVLGEDAELTVGPTGVIQDCSITGEGVLLVHGRMLNRAPETLTTSKVFFVGATGTAVGTVRQPPGRTRFGFEPGSVLRLTIRT